ncbi:3-hydroxyisobutyrate dehydrogenase [Amycolatopsis arida]|uniref:3-hydroxyisobutyrate dehydrogenase n=1 Tax=Amycolatopsis arida TaxID=587909 RepID=A0A1I6A907_9PSEU|nr:NAD(P)-dependent oxidoreductase [Amycolatopsis arida]TDX88508.1 3-hydroxyisobutyrate dehydrogenase-like beta-hydroxyacid dehydrogenase [Amycolatopsis arida]SFQ65158.1 3-hydroxyisobutyrate dehydrogenase [Amycolatopsis arida]
MNVTRPVACLGLGGMGAGLAGLLRDRGAPLTVYNRTVERVAPLVAQGARSAATPFAAVADAEVVLMSLADETAVEAVLFGPAGAAGGIGPDAVLVDTSTVSPSYSRDLSARLAAYGVRRVEACLVGNPSQARTGWLQVLAAGPGPALDEVADVLAVIGQREIVRLGEIGEASTMKLALNTLLGAQLVSLAEAVSYGVRAGIDRDLMLATIEGSGFSSLVMAFRCALMRERRYEPAAFRSVLMEKDLRLAVHEAKEHGVDIPVTEAAAGRFTELVRTGAADLDAAAVLELQTRDLGGEPDSRLVGWRTR